MKCALYMSEYLNCINVSLVNIVQYTVTKASKRLRVVKWEMAHLIERNSHVAHTKSFFTDYVMLQC